MVFLHQSNPVPIIFTSLAGGQQRSRMSLGSETVIAAAVAQATSAVVQPQAKRQPEEGHQKTRGSLPYEQRIDLPGQLFIKPYVISIVYKDSPSLSVTAKA